MRALKIDVETEEIIEIELSEDLPEFLTEVNGFLKCASFPEQYELPDNHVCMCLSFNEYKDSDIMGAFYLDDMHFICGHGVVIKLDDKANNSAATMTVQELKELVVFSTEGEDS